MAANEEVNQSTEDYVYRISTAEEWEALQKNGSMFGGELDRTSGYIHLSKLDQVSFSLYFYCLIHFVGIQIPNSQTFSLCKRSTY